MREAQGLSPEDLAERVEVPVERILALEAGDSRAQAELLMQAIRPLGLDEVSIELSRVMAADPYPEAPPSWRARTSRVDSDLLQRVREQHPGLTEEEAKESLEQAGE